MHSCTVLVVGGAGYIGSHMVRDLLDCRYRVIVLDDLSTGHRELVPGGEFVFGGLGDEALLEKVFSEHRIDAVMHFAACSLVGESMISPLKYYQNNVVATLKLINAMVRHNVKRFIFSSSAAVYGEPLAIPIAEHQPCRPTNPYGATKLMVEQILDDCRQAYDLEYVGLRYFNAAGAHPSGELGERHMPESHLIPLVLQVASGERESVNIYGTDYGTDDGTCVRDYVHVSDLTQAHLLALERLFASGRSGFYNLGNSRGYSVRQVIEAVRQVTGQVIPVMETERRAGDPAVLVADSQRARQEFGWQPRYESLATIIETAWQWHRREARRHR